MTPISIPIQFPIREGEAGNGLVGQRVGRFDESNVGEGVTARTSGVEQGFSFGSLVHNYT